jgi:hypothetical protein
LSMIAILGVVWIDVNLDIPALCIKCMTPCTPIFATILSNEFFVTGQHDEC